MTAPSYPTDPFHVPDNPRRVARPAEPQRNAFGRCTCPECTGLDRLPRRRQGIPGAFQARLV